MVHLHLGDQRTYGTSECPQVAIKATVSTHNMRVCRTNGASYQCVPRCVQPFFILRSVTRTVIIFFIDQRMSFSNKSFILPVLKTKVLKSGAYHVALTTNDEASPGNPHFFHEPTGLFLHDVKQSSLSLERTQEEVACQNGKGIQSLQKQPNQKLIGRPSATQYSLSLLSFSDGPPNTHWGFAEWVSSCNGGATNHPTNAHGVATLRITYTSHGAPLYAWLLVNSIGLQSQGFGVMDGCPGHLPTSSREVQAPQIFPLSTPHPTSLRLSTLNASLGTKIFPKADCPNTWCQSNCATTGGWKPSISPPLSLKSLDQQLILLGNHKLFQEFNVWLFGVGETWQMDYCSNTQSRRFKSKTGRRVGRVEWSDQAKIKFQERCAVYTVALAAA